MLYNINQKITDISVAEFPTQTEAKIIKYTDRRTDRACKLLLCKEGKGKVHPRTGHKGPQGEKVYSSTLSLTLALDRGGWSMPCPSHFTSGKDPVAMV
jgi:hypothetical protein